eukprot:14940-Amphidinium_carterae.1
MEKRDKIYYDVAPRSRRKRAGPTTATLAEDSSGDDDNDNGNDGDGFKVGGVGRAKLAQKGSSTSLARNNTQPSSWSFLCCQEKNSEEVDVHMRTVSKLQSEGESELQHIRDEKARLADRRSKLSGLRPIRFH